MGKGIYKYLSGGSFIGCVVTIILGFNRMLVYDNGEYYPYELKNAYVGGDAYNYIINGNHSTAFFVLATLFAILGIGFIVLYYLSVLENCSVSCKNDCVEISKKTKTIDSQITAISNTISNNADKISAQIATLSEAISQNKEINTLDAEPSQSSQ